MDQTAKRDAGKPRPTLEDWIKFYREWECGNASAE